VASLAGWCDGNREGGPSVVEFESWIDRQIREAIERGEFDNLAGAGKPLPGLDRQDDDWWIKAKLERENVRGLLPPSLALRREAQDIDETVAELREESQVRAVVEDLNARILDARRRAVDGPIVFVRTADVEVVLETWRNRRRQQ
jgi:hypothetical protein